MRSRPFKDGLYTQLARVGRAIANAHRLEILELLAQSERTVESLAEEAELSIANTSQHLQVLRDGGLVESRKDGLHVHYRLSDPSVFELCRALRSVGERRLAELDRLVRTELGARLQMEAIGMRDLLSRMRAGNIVVIDARPAHEYEAGHIAGAISIPIDEIDEIDEIDARLRDLPKRKEFVAYCRGPYCVYADRAVEALRASGRRAKRLDDGFPEWKAAGFPIVAVTHERSNVPRR